MTKLTTFNFRIDPDLKEAAERAAAADERSLAGYISKVLRDHLRREGFLPERRPCP